MRGARAVGIGSRAAVALEMRGLSGAFIAGCHCGIRLAKQPLQPTSDTDIVPAFNSVRTELLICRSRLSGRT
jgi:hypothetical protein